MLIRTKLLVLAPLLLTVTPLMHGMIPVATITPAVLKLKALTRTVPAQISDLTASTLRTDAKILVLQKRLKENATVRQNLLYHALGQSSAVQLSHLHQNMQFLRASIDHLAHKRYTLTSEIKQLETGLQRAVSELEAQLATAAPHGPAGRCSDTPTTVLKEAR